MAKGKPPKRPANPAPTEPESDSHVVVRQKVLARPAPKPAPKAPRGNRETRVIPWGGPAPDRRPPSIGSMQPPGVKK